MTRMPQGHCTLPADDAGRVLDRLAGLEQMIRPEDVQQALTATGRVNSAQLSVDARGRLVGGAGHGVVNRFADPTGLQGRPAAPQRRGVAAPLQPLRRPSAVGRGAGAAPVPPSHSPPGPAGDAGGVLRRLAVDGARRHDLRCPRLGGQRGRLRPPLGRAARRRRLPSGPQVQLGRVGDPCRSRHGGAVLRPWRAIDVRRFVPPSDVGDAPALGPGILQL